MCLTGPVPDGQYPLGFLGTPPCRSDDPVLETRHLRPTTRTTRPLPPTRPLDPGPARARRPSGWRELPRHRRRSLRHKPCRRRSLENLAVARPGDPPGAPGAFSDARPLPQLASTQPPRLKRHRRPPGRGGEFGTPQLHHPPTRFRFATVSAARRRYPAASRAPRRSVHVRCHRPTPAAIPAHARGRALHRPVRPHPGKTPHLRHRPAATRSSAGASSTAWRTSRLGSNSAPRRPPPTRAPAPCCRRSATPPWRWPRPAPPVADAARPCPPATLPDPSASSWSCSARCPAISRRAMRRTSWLIRSSASPRAIARRRSTSG